MLDRVRGFTLTELMVTLAVLGIFVSVAVPAMNRFVDTNRVIGIAEVVAGEVQLARTEAVKRNLAVSLSFRTGDESWCFGIDENPGCNCTLTDVNDANACTLPAGGVNTLKASASTTYRNITVTQTFAGNVATFNPVRGTVNAGAIALISSGGNEVQVQVSALGRVHVCSSDIAGYPACS